MKKFLILISFLLLSIITKSQVVVLHFNAGWNSTNNVEWVEDLDDCDVDFIDIAVKTKLQKEYSIVVVPTLVILQYDEETKRYQADLSFKLAATKEEVQEYIDELILSGF
ncbi:MAG: hypothetical protein HKN40_08945 [Winogradskyella sp.]|uniref:hypothetical protein n=1 Tax=Winogradskyella sp. TaxID=1883156 RepID=UPI0017CD4554|nr:hypothetical protein [Winogradskyella sp.]